MQIHSCLVTYLFNPITLFNDFIGCPLFAINFLVLNMGRIARGSSILRIQAIVFHFTYALVLPIAAVILLV